MKHVGCVVAVAICMVGCGSSKHAEESCELVEKSLAKAEKLVAGSLVAQGGAEPALLDGRPSPVAFTAAGTLKGDWRTFRDELIRAEVDLYACRGQEAPKATGERSIDDRANYARLLAAWKSVKGG